MLSAGGAEAELLLNQRTLAGSDRSACILVIGYKGVDKGVLALPQFVVADRQVGVARLWRTGDRKYGDLEVQF